MFKVTLADIALLRDPLASIAEIIDEGTFKAGKDGLRFVAADRAMVAVVDFSMAPTAFEKYEASADDGKEQKLGLNITNLLSVLKRAGTGDKLSMELTGAKMQITIEGTSKRRFVVPLLDLGDEEVPPVDQLDFKAAVQVKSDVLMNGVNDAEIIADSIIFETTPAKFLMLAEGDTNRAELELEKGSDALVELRSQGTVKARYALDYLKKIMKAAKISDSVTIEYGEDYPMRLSFAAGDKACVRFVLAPRVVEN
ncbi:MAG: proliferating cell nuclear antigen (pcna) [Candidatus Aenigmarchaeota archaeon]|nr:proliferating cell nuclear antigen (pcna) [Candidatus Aenigmarchaeota archaeon]